MNEKLEELRAQDLEKAAAIQQNLLKKNSDTKNFPFDVCIWNKMANASQLVVMLDNFLKEIVPVGNFITGAICCVDTKTKTIHVFNCGHTNVFAYIKDEAGKGRVATLEPTLPPFPRE